MFYDQAHFPTATIDYYQQFNWSQLFFATPYSDVGGFMASPTSSRRDSISLGLFY
jgi:hypothetical protein